MSLPKGYKRLEYIQSSGTQYIDSEFVPTANTRVEADFQFTNADTTNQALFGTAGQFSFRWFGSGKCFRTNGSNNVDFPTSIDGSARHTVVKTATSTTIDGTHTVQTTAANVTATLFLFGQQNTTGGVNNYGKVRIWSLKIYDNGTLVRDFAPCTRNADGAVGLWDAVNEVFYGNAGTGEFAAGPEVQTVPKAPANFRVVSESGTTVVLAWDLNEEAAGYRLYRSGQLLADTTETSVSVTVEPFAGAVFTVTAYNENGEGAGAELTYSNAPEKPILFLVTDRTQADVSARNSKGAYNAVDLNRVGCAVRYLANFFTAEGYVVNVSPKTDWTAADVVYPADAEAYLADIAELRRQLTVMSFTPKTPDTLEKLRYTTANDIEQILVDLDLLLRNAVAAQIYYGGDLFAGEV